MQNYADLDSVDTVEAEMLTGDNVTVISVWSGARVVEEIDPISADRYAGLNIETSRGVERASLGDYIVKRPSGVFDVYKPIAFKTRFKMVPYGG